MAEYIEREIALEIVKRTSGDYAAAFAEIAHHPAADVAPVVRCRECLHGRPCGPEVACYHPAYEDNEGVWAHKPEFYCAYGERLNHADQ